jgi:CelD/BcsL family acetyltransferase involved in cellulose biosynthesis
MRALAREPGEEILVPAYNCGSEVEALIRAGFSCRFYEGTDLLEPDESELESLLSERVRGLYLIHYFGFQQDVLRWRRWCDERRLLLIEDAAQAWLGSVNGRPLGSFGDLAIVCMHKTVGVPDGAALVSPLNAPGASERGELGVTSLARRHAAWVLSRSASLAALASRFRPETDFGSEHDYQAHLDAAAPAAFALGERPEPPTAATLFTLPRVWSPEVAAQRRIHYGMLLDELREMVPVPFAHLPDEASPLALPVESPTKTRLLERLAAHGVRALDLWPVPHPLIPTGRFPRASAWRARVLALPVHQELTAADLDRVVAAARPRSRGGPAFSLELVDSFDALRDEWAGLAERSGNVFATWQWLSTWWRHFGGDSPELVRACRSRDGKLVAILPLYAWSTRPVRIVRFLGHGAGDQLGPVCAAEDRIPTAKALRGFLSELEGRWDVFLAEQLPGDQSWDSLLGARLLRRHASPVIRFETASWEEFLRSCSANLRQQVRRRERRLARDHDLRYRLASDPAQLDDDLDTLFALHGAVWPQGESAFAGEREAFQREFAACALENGWLRLWFLELDGRAVAAWYGLRFCGVDSYYQAGRDPALAHASVGFVLLAHSIRQALEDGMREYRFLRGDEGFKYRFATEDPGLDTVGVSATMPGAAALAAGAATRRLPRFPEALRRPLDL